MSHGDDNNEISDFALARLTNLRYLDLENNNKITN